MEEKIIQMIELEIASKTEFARELFEDINSSNKLAQANGIRLFEQVNAQIAVLKKILTGFEKWKAADAGDKAGTTKKEVGR